MMESQQHPTSRFGTRAVVLRANISMEGKLVPVLITARTHPFLLARVSTAYD